MPFEIAHPLLGLVLGAAAGAVAQRTHFCTMGAVSDVALFGSLRRLRSLALAAGLALTAIQLLIATGGLLPAAGAPGGGMWGVLVGGVAFGFGSVLAGGCALRLLTRLGSGSLKALIAVLAMALVGAIAMGGVLSWPAAAVAGVGPPLSADPMPAALALPLGIGLLGLALREPACRRPSPETAVALTLAAVATASAWITAGPAFGYAVPLAQALGWLTTGGASSFGVGLVAGTLLGALLAALAAGRLRLETFTARDDMLRHLGGGALMGLGGAVAGGCSIAHGVSGLAFLSVAAVIALIGIGAGVVWGLRWLETGRLLPGWWRRRDRSTPG